MLRSADTQRGASGDPAADGQDSGGEHIVADSQAAADSLGARVASSVTPPSADARWG